MVYNYDGATRTPALVERILGAAARAHGAGAASVISSSYYSRNERSLETVDVPLIHCDRVFMNIENLHRPRRPWTKNSC